jgi:hypothetical protein
MRRSEVANRKLTDDEAWIVSHNLPLVDACLCSGITTRRRKHWQSCRSIAPRIR